MMDKSSKPGPFACKFLYDDDCTPIFRIPSRLVKSYGNDMPPMATLTIYHSQKCWKVSVEKFKGQYFFTDGWKEFAQEANLKTREYLLFRAAGLCEFHISPDESDNEEELSSGEYTGNSEDGDSFTEGENGPRVGKSVTYTTELRTHHKQKLGLPRKLIKQTGLKTGKRLLLQNAEGMQWPVRLTSSGRKYGLTAGIVDFLIANKLTVGSIMSFKFVSGSGIVEARVVKQGTNKNALFNFVKRRGNKYEVFEPDKTSDLAKEAKNLQADREHAEGTQNSYKTSEPTEGPGNLYVMSEHSEGSGNFHKTSECTEEPENFHKMSEDAEGHKSSLKKRSNRPENFHKTSEIAKRPESLHTTCGHGEDPENLHETRGNVEGPEILHGNVKSENEGHFPEEEDDNGFESDDEEELSSGEYAGNSEHRDSFTEGESGPSVGKSITYTTALRTHHKQKLGLPRKFIKQAGLKTGERLLLENAEGMQWPVRLTSSQGKYGLAAGLVDFLIANKLTVGSIMSFKFVSGSYGIVEARVIKQGTNKNALFNYVKRRGNKFEVFEPDKTSDLAKEAENLHAAREHAEGTQNSYKTSEPTEGPGNLCVMSEHSEGSGNFHKTSERTEEPEIFQKMSEDAKGPKNSLKKRSNRPENFHKTHEIAKRPESLLTTSGHREEPGNLHETRGHVEGPEILHGSIKSENEGHFPEEEDDNGFERRWTFSKKLKKDNAYKVDITRHENVPLKDAGCSKFHFPQDASNTKEFNSGDCTEDSEDDDCFTNSKDGPNIGSSFTFTVELKCYNKHKLVLPGEFVKQAGLEMNTGLILQDAEGRQWPVRLTNNYALTAGWVNFLFANEVTVGSIMSFKFVSGSNKTLEAHVTKQGANKKALFNLVKRIGNRFEVIEPGETDDVSRGTKKSRTTSEIGEGPEISHETSESDDEMELNSGDYTANIEDGCSFTDGDNGPVGKSFTFTTELKNHHKGSFRLSRNFVKQAGLEEDKELMLQDVEERQWPVRITRSCGKCVLTAGWVEFLIANKVTVGSLISFKFVSGSNKIMEARVIKQGTNEKALFNFVKRKGSKYEVFEPDKISDLAMEAKNLHTTKELGEGSQHSNKTSEQPEGTENQHAVPEHAEVPRNSYKISEHTENTDNFHTMSEPAEGPVHFLKTSERDWPKNFRESSDIATGPENLHVTSGHGEEPEKSHANVKSENQENGFCVEGRWTFSKKLKKHDAYKLDIPRHISKVMEKTTSGGIKLRDHKGRKWPVRLEYRACGAYTMKYGWHDFLAGNKVYVGSTISFEFVPNSDSSVIEARVIENGEKGIERFVKKAKCWSACQYSTNGWKESAREPFPPDSSNGKELNSGGETADQDSGDGVDKSLTCTMELKSHHRNRLELPKKFTEQARLKKDKKFVLQDVDGRQWPVRLTDRKKHGTYALTAGWFDFLVATKVSVGSMMSFKLVSGSKNNVDVRVIKEGPNKNVLFNYVRRNVDKLEVFEPGEIGSSGNGTGNLRENCHNTIEEPQNSHANLVRENEDYWVEVENGFGAGRKQMFSKQLKKHNAYKLDIPRDVSKIIERMTEGDVKLLDSKGRKWPVRLAYRKCGAYRMTSGWNDFLVGNKVYVGSMVSFEYNSNKDKHVIEVRVTENRENGTEPFVKKAKGRPPC